MTIMKQQQQSFFRVLMLVLLGIYCLCGIATAIPISEDNVDDGVGLSLFGDMIPAKGEEEEDALHIVPRDGGRERGGNLYSVMVVNKRNNNYREWGGLDGNGNADEDGFLALNNNSPVVGKGLDGQALGVASLSSSSSSSSSSSEGGGEDSSVPSKSTEITAEKQQQPWVIDPIAL